MEMKHDGLILMLLLLASPLTEAQVLTLNDAVQLAVGENRNVQVSALDVVKAGEVVAQTKTECLPQFKAFALGGESLTPIDYTIPQGALGIYSSTGAIPAQTAHINTPQTLNGLIYASATQPLTQLHKIGLAIRESRVGEEVAQESFRQQKQETAHQVKEAYHQIVQMQTQISSAQESLKYLIELAALTDRNLAQQTALKSDSLNVKAKVSQQRYQ